MIQLKGDDLALQIVSSKGKTNFLKLTPEAAKKIAKIMKTMIPESINEGRYHDYRNDESMTPKQKIGRSMREIRDSLNNLDKLVKMNVRLKNELKVDSRSYWKNTHKALNKISERLVKLANKVGQLQQSNTMPFEDNKKSYMDTLFSIATLLKRWQVEIQNKDIDKNYMLRRLNQWIEQLESLKHEIMMGRDK